MKGIWFFSYFESGNTDLNVLVFWPIFMKLSVCNSY